jgi:DNA-binding transcriptional LysR family regulator
VHVTSNNFEGHRVDPRTDLQMLEAFYWVAILKNFHRAATKLNTTQPAISRRIAQLETCLGGGKPDKGRLLVRDKRAVGLTDRGRLLMPQVERLLMLHRDLCEQVGGTACLNVGLRIGVAETIVHTWLPAFWKHMIAAYPRVVLEFDVDITVNLQQQLLERKIDLAFMVGPADGAEIRNRPLSKERLAFLASPGLGFPRRTSLGAIAEHPIITYSRRTQPFVNLSALFTDPRPLIHASASVAAIVKMAEDGLGVAVLPPTIVREQIAAGRLVELQCKERLPDLEFVVGWLPTPDIGLVERVAEMAGDVAEQHQAATRAEGRKPRRGQRQASMVGR